MDYEPPTLTEVGSVRDLTLGGDTWRQWDDEFYLWGFRLPAPGSGVS